MECDREGLFASMYIYILRLTLSLPGPGSFRNSITVSRNWSLWSMDVPKYVFTYYYFSRCVNDILHCHFHPWRKSSRKKEKINLPFFHLSLSVERSWVERRIWSASQTYIYTTTATTRMGTRTKNRDNMISSCYYVRYHVHFPEWEECKTDVNMVKRWIDGWMTLARLSLLWEGLFSGTVTFLGKWIRISQCFQILEENT